MSQGSLNFNKKSPRGIRTRRRSPSRQGAKYIMVTQDTRPSGVAKVCIEDLFGCAKTMSLGLMTDKKKGRTRHKKRKWVVLDHVLMAAREIYTC